MPAVRIKARQEHNRVALTVIYFLGTCSLLGLWSCHDLIAAAVDSDHEIDAAVVALIGQQVSITTLALAALGAMLSSTSPKPPTPPTVPAGSDKPESMPVTIVNPPADPVPTDPQPVVEPEPEQADELEPEPEPEPEPDPAPRRRRRAAAGVG